MADLNDLIKYENENTTLDFKAVQYGKEMHEALIKDIMSMANADVENDRYIIVGVKYEPSGNRKILGIRKEEFIDSATYQQLIKSNIEPDITFDYLHHEHEGKTLGIFKISHCIYKPYLMKKDFKTLKQGDGYIRKGSHQCGMDRRDYDKIYESRIGPSGFKGNVRLGFSGYDWRQEIELVTTGEVKLPSQENAEEIRKVIKRKTQSGDLEARRREHVYDPLNYLGLEGFSYEQLTIKELEERFKNIKTTYYKEDSYKLFELNSHKINISILNQGHTYIEDASVQLEIGKMAGLLVADEVHEKPKYGNILSKVTLPVLSYDFMNYPRVTYSKSSITICENIGAVRHQIPDDVFKVPLRMVLLDELAGKTIEMSCQIFGKNLAEPITEILRIKAVAESKGR